MISGGAKGDIIVWNSQLQPLVIMYPNLSESAGSVTLMIVIKAPFIQILVGFCPYISSFYLLTNIIHYFIKITTTNQLCILG